MLKLLFLMESCFHITFIVFFVYSNFIVNFAAGNLNVLKL